MLVLKRRLGESVVITVPAGKEAQTIEVHAVEFGVSGVRLGFIAPKSVTIHRSEIQERADKATSSGVQYDQTLGEDYA